MPTITYTLDDGFGTVGKKLKLKWQPATIRTHDGALVVGGPPKEVFSTVGTPTTIEGIASGMWAISNFGVAGGHRTAYIDVDEVGGDVTALIEAAVAVPQNAPVTDVIAAAKAAAEVAVGGLDVLTQEAADAAYVRLEDYEPGGSGTLTEDPARPGTFVVSGGLLTENPSRPGTFLIGA